MGEVFAGRYELLDLIGQGAMGSVWRAHDRKTDRVVAAKVLRQSDAASLLRFVRETAFRVQHPHVVTPLGWAGEDDRVLFTMPVVDGGSVATLVGDHGPLPPRLVAEILRQVLDALVAVHSSGIVHRDLKPANILLAATGSARPHAYLTDFGIAVELGGPRLTETDFVIGTPGFMAPEQHRGEVTTASDLYALGVLAEYLLTAERREPHGAARETRPDQVPVRLWEVVRSLVAVDPKERPGAAEALGRLQGHELAWVPGAAGDVEVMRQVGSEQEPKDEPPAVVEDEFTTAARHMPESEPPRNGRAVGLIAGVGVLLVAVVTVSVLLWAPWSGDSRSPERTATTSSSTASSSTTDDPSPASTSTSSASPGTSSSGSVSVGTVVTTVGQQCQFSDVGVRERTSGGVDVICRLGDDGDYTWERSER